MLKRSEVGLVSLFDVKTLFRQASKVLVPVKTHVPPNPDSNPLPNGFVEILGPAQTETV